MNPIPLPWMIVGSLGLTIGAFLAGGYAGRALCQNGYFKAEQKAEAKHEQVIAGAQAADQEAADREVIRQATVREIIREVPTVIQGNPVYHNVCVDAGGVQLLRRAIETANGGSPGGGPAGDPGDVRTDPADQ